MENGDASGCVAIVSAIIFIDCARVFEALSTRHDAFFLCEKLEMARKTSNCAICENSNQASICSICVNYRLNEYNTSLKLLKDRRDSLYLKLSEVLVRKGKGDDQANWRVLQHEKLARLKEKLRQSKEQVTQGRAKIETMSADLKLKYGLLESALSTLEKNRVEQLEKFYPNLICTQSLGHVAITSELLHKESVVIKQICKLFPQRRVVIEGERRDGCSGQYDQICNARLPRALDPHSVPSEELSTSLGSWADPTQPYPIFCSKAQPSHAAQHRTQPSHATRSNTPYGERSPAATSPRSPRTTQQRRAPAHDPTAATSTGRRPREGDAAPTPHPHDRRRTSRHKYMVQLLNLVIHNLAAPALHNSGFAGSCSRIWQRDSYWDARPSSRSNEYPLFIPRQNYCSTDGENSWSERSSSNFGVASVESERRHRLDSSGSTSFNYSLASSHSVQTHKDLQKGISLLKKSVVCITAYCYNSLCLDVPSEASTFEAFAKLLATLASSKEVRSVFSLKMARSRTCKQVQQLNKSVWNMNSAISSTTLLESAHSVPTTRIENYLPSSTGSFLYAADLSDGKNECLIEGWDIVEHPTFPPPPSQSEDVEHWTRAMFIDAKGK
ncbi:hypothetical protein GmHk_14G041802 [Glycine max]|nr:hypothetical protein GmHk_14G041802 [Glycine max]